MWEAAKWAAGVLATNKELGELLRALDDKIFPPYYSALIRLLIVFGCRTTELRRSEVQEFGILKKCSGRYRRSTAKRKSPYSGQYRKAFAVRHATGGAEQTHGLIAW